MGIGCSLQTFVKHHGSSYMILLVQNPGPFCPEAWSVLSWNVVRFVLRRGPFCPGTWSVLSGPFCPWSVLSEYSSKCHGMMFPSTPARGTRSSVRAFVTEFLTILK